MSGSYSIWLDLAEGHDRERFATEIQAIAEHHGLAAFEPHITVLGGFDCEESAAIECLHQLGERFTAFEAQLTSLRYEDVWNRAAILLAESPRLTPLHQQACTLLDVSAGPYQPHASLAYTDHVEEVRTSLVADAAARSLGPVTMAGLSLWFTPGAGAFDVPRWKKLDAITVGEPSPSHFRSRS